MDSKYAGIFIEALNTVLESFTSIQVISADIRVPSENHSTDDISVMIGIVGDIHGQVYMTMNAKTGQILASEMLGEIDVTEVDEMVVSAVSELCNMIMGNACSSICADNTMIDITPPIVISDEEITLSKGQIAYNICFILEKLGMIDFNVSVKNA
jgi:chemotaxis protein CheX